MEKNAKNYRKTKKNTVKNERAVMAASSMLLLAALTLTGIFMGNNEKNTQDDGYTLDFSQIEIQGDEKFQEIANAEKDLTQNEDALDYVPMEVGSAKVENPVVVPETDGAEVADGATVDEAGDGEALAEAQPTEEFHFQESEGLLRPVSGEVLMPYSMDGSIYFATLDQYKYNPAVIISAKEDSVVASCAEGRVVRVYETPETGGTVIVDLGGGYEITYSQLKNVAVATGDYVGAGYLIGHVAKPTKYYTVEGSNLYLKMTKDGEPIDAAALFR